MIISRSSINTDRPIEILKDLECKSFINNCTSLQKERITDFAERSERTHALPFPIKWCTQTHILLTESFSWHLVYQTSRVSFQYMYFESLCNYWGMWTTSSIFLLLTSIHTVTEKYHWTSHRTDSRVSTCIFSVDPTFLIPLATFPLSYSAHSHTDSRR